MNFKVRAYGRTELAQMYCPNLQPESAFRKLCRWISLEPELSRRLLKNGKMPPVRSFTPAALMSSFRFSALFSIGMIIFHPSRR